MLYSMLDTLYPLSIKSPLFYPLVPALLREIKGEVRKGGFKGGGAAAGALPLPPRDSFFLHFYPL